MPVVHSVCVCTYHQNTKLLVEAIHSPDTYKDLLAKLVCSTENKKCMLGRCDNCPDKEELSNHLHNFFGDYAEDFQITYTQWDTTVKATLSTRMVDVPSFIEILITSLEELKPHSFISREQARYLNELKENRAESSVILLVDFAENYSFVVHDEVQSFHWNNMQCSLHPVVIYYRKDAALHHLSYTVISDDTTHDVNFVYKVIQVIISDIKQRLNNLNFVYFFKDGCAGQYKNQKTMFNLCQLEKEFQLKAE